MTDQHSITPPPYLVQQWRHSWLPNHGEFVDYVATQASQWGADQELEACCEWLVSEGWFKYEHKVVEDLRAARRPKPPTLKEQALDELHISFDRGYLKEGAADTIRRALEQLDD